MSTFTFKVHSADNTSTVSHLYLYLIIVSSVFVLLHKKSKLIKIHLLLVLVYFNTSEGNIVVLLHLSGTCSYVN